MIELKKYREISKDEFFVIGVDTSAGGGDYCAAQFLSKTCVDVPWVYHSPQTATQMTNDLVVILNELYDITNIKPVIAYERNNGGSFEMERLAGLNRDNKYRIYRMVRPGFVDYHEEVKLGWETSTATRPVMLQQLKDAIDKHVIGIYDQETVDELFTFVTVKTSSIWKAQAESNAHDDLVMALAIAWQLYQTETADISPATKQKQRDLLQQIETKGERW